MATVDTGLTSDDFYAILREEETLPSLRIEDLDDFLLNVYCYWNEKGFLCMMTSKIVNILMIAFTVCYSAFLLLWVDWAECLRCARSSKNCMGNVVGLNGAQHGWFYLTLVSLYLIIFCLYLVWSVYRLIPETALLLKLRSIFEKHLKVGTADQLQALEWADLADRLVDLIRKRKLPGIPDTLTPIDIVNRIMRKENYMIGLLNKELLDIRVPFSCISQRRMLTKTLEWNINHCVLEYMFDNKCHIKETFLNDVNALRRRFRWFGILNFVLAPFILMFIVIYFFIKNAAQFHKDPMQLGNRQWSQYALWRLREFNELPHVFNRRIGASCEYADKYLRLFPSHFLSIIARFLAFVLSAFVGTLVVMGLLSESLMSSSIGERNLWWYLAVCGTLLALVRSFIVPKAMTDEPKEVLRQCAQHTHYMPKGWRNREHTVAVCDEVSNLFQNSVLLFMHEIVGIVVTPFILWLSLPNCAQDLIEFVRDFTVDQEGVGHVCGFAVFDFHRFGNSKYGAPHGVERQFRSRQGKMEKSYLNFLHSHRHCPNRNNPNSPHSPGQAEADQFLSRLGLQTTYHSAHFEPHMSTQQALVEGSAEASGLLHVANHDFAGLHNSIPDHIRQDDLSKYYFWMDRFYSSQYQYPEVPSELEESRQKDRGPLQEMPELRPRRPTVGENDLATVKVEAQSG